MFAAKNATKKIYEKHVLLNGFQFDCVVGWDAVFGAFHRCFEYTISTIPRGWNFVLCPIGWFFCVSPHGEKSIQAAAVTPQLTLITQHSWPQQNTLLSMSTFICNVNLMEHFKWSVCLYVRAKFIRSPHDSNRMLGKISTEAQLRQRTKAKRQKNKVPTHTDDLHWAASKRVLHPKQQ